LSKEPFLYIALNRIYGEIAMSSNERNTIFIPLLVAGIIIIIFGGICIWIAQIIQLKEEGEGFAIIGLRFVIGGIGEVVFVFVWRYLAYIRYMKKRNRKFDDLYKP
jgi:hypothetical protein